MRLVLVPVLGLLLAGCGGRDMLPPVGQVVPVPAASAAATPDPRYLMNPLDVIRIDVFGEPELSLRDLPIGTDGRIVMPMVGPIEAAGLTTQQLTDRLKEALNRYLRNPQVSVNVTEYVSQVVTVSGAVNRPGRFQAPGRVTLMQAVALGGGIGDFGKLSEVVVFREENGQQFVARFDLGAIQNGQAADPVIRSGDTVVVGYSNARRLFRDVLSVLPFAAGVFVAVIN